MGFDPNPTSQDEFAKHIKKSVGVEGTGLEEKCAQFCNNCHYITLKIDEGDTSFEELRDLMESFKHGDQEQQRIFYMALPPSVYVKVSEQLRRCCKTEEGGVSRIIVGNLGNSNSAKVGY